MHPGKSVARTVRSILVRRSSDTYFLPALQSGFFYDCGDSIPTIAPVNKIKSFTLGAWPGENLRLSETGTLRSK